MYQRQTENSFTNSVNKAKQKLNCEQKAAVNNTYESYEILVQIETLQEDWNKKCSRLNPMLHTK